MTQNYCPLAYVSRVGWYVDFFVYKNFMSHRQGIHVNSKLLIQDMIPNKKKLQE